MLTPNTTQQPAKTPIYGPPAPPKKQQQKPVTGYGPLPPAAPSFGGIPLTIKAVNDVVSQVDIAHKRLLGTSAHPGLVYDVARGVAQGVVKDVNHLFDVPLTKTDATARQAARTVAPAPSPALVTDPGSAKAIEAAQGHPLTPSQREALRMAKGQETVFQARQRLTQAGVLPQFHEVHDEGNWFNQLAGGALLFSTGLMASMPIMAVQEGGAAYQDIRDTPLGSFGFHNPFGSKAKAPGSHVAHTTAEIAKGVVVRTYHDVHAIVTGDMKYLRANPDAYYNVGFLALGAAGGLSRISSAAAATRTAAMRASVPATYGNTAAALEGLANDTEAGNPYGQSIVFKDAHVKAQAAQVRDLRDAAQHLRDSEAAGLPAEDAMRRIPSHIRDALGHPLGIAAGAKAGLRELIFPTVEPKVMEHRGASVNALNFTNPIVRWADNLRTNRMADRSALHKEPVPAAMLRAVGLQSAADIVSKNFSYEAKFRRETDANRRAEYVAQTHLIRKLDDVTSSAIDVAGALDEVQPKVKNSLSIGELKAMHVFSMGGDWMEAIRTMRNAHKTWMDFGKVAGNEEIVRNHAAQLAALTLAEKVIRDGETEGFSKMFNRAFPTVKAALEQSTTTKIDNLGLAPETADVRNALEYEVYKGQRPIPNRKAIATLIKATEANVGRLESQKGFVPVEHTTALEKAQAALAAAPEATDVLYHGSPFAFKDFSTEHAVEGKYGKGIYFTKDKPLAEHYSKASRGAMTPSPNVRSAKANITNPFEAERVMSRPKIGALVKALNDEGLGGDSAAMKQLMTWTAKNSPKGSTVYRILRSITGEETNAFLGRHGYDAIVYKGEQGAPESANYVIFDTKNVGAAESPEAIAAQKKIAAAQKKITAAQEADHPQLAVARKRLESLKMLMEKTEARVAGAEKREGAFRLPLKNRLEAAPGSTAPGFPARTANEFGEFMPASPSEITHSFTGKGLIDGDTRLDFTNTAARDLARSIKTSAWVNDYKTKLESSVHKVPDGPTARFYLPIRREAEIHDKIREMVNKIKEPGLTADDVKVLTDEEVNALNDRAYAYPKIDNDGTKRWVDRNGNPIDLKNYDWYDERAHPMYREYKEGALAKGFNNFYIIGRLKIFIAPRYILNLPSNFAMNAIHENIMSPPALAASYFAHKIYDQQTIEMMDEQVGSSRTGSLAPMTKDMNPPTAAISGIAHFWHWITDTHPRRAAFIWEAWRKGYTSADDMRRLLTDPANAADLTEISRRANKGMVELNNMTWAEQQYLRHIIFVWPWRSRQAIWSLRTLAEHPAQSAILAEIGENGLSTQLDNEPTWVRAAIKKYLAAGFAITGWNPDGSPKGVMAGNINTFSGLQDVLGVTGMSAAAGVPFRADSLGPGLQYFFEAITGNDSYGRALPGKGNLPSQALHAFLDVAIGQQPLTLAYKRGGKFQQQPKIPPFNLADRNTILKQINAGQRMVALSPGWLDGYGMIFSGGATPRSISKYKMLYDYYHSLDDRGRQKFELDTIHQVLNIQSQLLQRPLPKGVTTAISAQNEFTFQQNKMTKDLGMNGGIPDLIKDQLLLTVLQKKGLITKAEGDKQLAKLEKIPGLNEKDHQQARNDWMVAYAHAGDLNQWTDDVKRFASFTPEGLKGKVARLHDFGLSQVPLPNATQKTLYQYGRNVLDYEDKVRELTKQIKGEQSGVEKAKLKSELTNFIADSDQPVTLDGKTFPSLVRMSYGDTPEKERRAQLVSIATHSWKSLSTFDREILTGKPYDTVVDRGWAWVNEQMAKEKARLHPGESLKPGLRNYYVQWAAKQSPAFAQSLKEAAEPLARRMLGFTLIKDSPYRKQWETVLNGASSFVSRYIKAGYVKSNGVPDWTAIQAEWRNTLNPNEVNKWVAEQGPGFQKEYQEFLNSNSDFLLKLVHP